MKFEVKIPTIGESINEVTIGQWLVENGQQVEEDQIICEIESEKATIEITVEQSGVIKLIAKEGDTVNIGSVIAEIDGYTTKSSIKKIDSSKSDETSDNAETAPLPAPDLTSLDITDNKVSPVAANMLKEAGIPIGKVKGTGQGGKDN